jgi:hypothetical protein
MHRVCTMFSSTKKIVDVMWDTGATVSVTPHKNDFVTLITKTKSLQVMKGIAKGLMIEGTDDIEYAITTPEGKLVCI